MNPEQPQTEFVEAGAPVETPEYSIRIANITREEHLETSTFFLDVTIDVMKGEEVLHSRKIAFPDGTTEEDIRTYIAALKDSYINAEIRLAQLEEKKAALNAHLIGEVIS